MSLPQAVAQVVSREWRKAHNANVAEMARIHWHGIIRDPNTIVVNGEAYTVGEEHVPAYEFRGFGGRKFVILKGSERIESTNLWARGTVPQEYRDVLADNAEFAEGFGL